MSDGLNRVTLLGNLGADPEYKQTNQGAGLLTIRLATAETWVDKNKELKERTEWHDVALFGNRAEPLSRILGKGDKVLVEGSIRTSSWEKDGEKRYRTEIVAQNLWLAGRPRSSRAAEESGGPATKSRRPAEARVSATG